MVDKNYINKQSLPLKDIMKNNVKYTKENLTPAVKASKSYAGVLRFLGLKQAGGTQSNIKKRIEKFKINTDHFTGMGWNIGSISNMRKSAKDILILKNNDIRTKAPMLRRALLEIGHLYECSECFISEYNGKDITLHVDHIDGNYNDNRKENVRFLCPNCHSQTETFGNKKRNSC